MYRTTKSSPTTIILIVVLGVATIISVALYLTKLLGQLLMSSHDGVEAGVGGGLGCFQFLEHRSGFNLCCFKLTKALIGDVNVFSEAINLQAHMALKLL
jgi:hypothetical protein